MSYDLQEQEQVDALKAWWKDNSGRVNAVAAAVLAGVLAYQGWNWYSQRAATEASAMYDQFEQAAVAKDAKRTKEAAGSLIEKHGGTVYAALAALRDAKISLDAGDRESARLRLRWAVDHAAQKEIALLARVRLAGVLLDDKAYDEALKVLDVDVPDAFATEFADRRGDILVAQGKPAQARAAYTEALAKASPQQPLRSLIQLKLDSLGPASGA
jgi:predicted negative regulator of RcsB-dependent stress response